MKAVFVALFALVAVASAGIVVPAGLGYSSVIASPLSYAAAPYAVAAPVAVAPAIQSGYVAATRGSVHTAPLPQGPFAFSHHINTAPAPGTF
ncbi:adult cuticle protein 1-like [Tenebrio molitor]|uniref:adult cuticle protein 1-like n=1 Tax=Tenebrio molitor TaxID=7067 RepID=UPI003624802B